MEKTERYNYVFDQYDGDSFIYDLKEDKRIDDLSQCAYILNKKEKEIERWFEHKKFDAQINRDLLDKIEELETRLSNCIEPKFKVGQEVWIIHLRKVKKSKIFLISWDNNFIFRYGLEGGGYLLEKFEDELFITAEEALKKLEELKNG